jgi:hypothetical protein
LVCPGGNQVQQVLLPGGELGDGVAAAFGVQVGLVQVRAQQGEQRPVALGEVRAGPADKVEPHRPPGPGGSPRRTGQAQLELMLRPQGPVILAVHAGGVPLPRRVEVRDLHDGAQVAGAVG